MVIFTISYYNFYQRQFIPGLLKLYCNLYNNILFPCVRSNNVVYRWKFNIRVVRLAQPLRHPLFARNTARHGAVDTCRCVSTPAVLSEENLFFARRHAEAMVSVTNTSEKRKKRQIELSRERRHDHFEKESTCCKRKKKDKRKRNSHTYIHTKRERERERGGGVREIYQRGNS